MHPGIRIATESARGCGWRKTGGLYLVGEDLAAPCGRMPIPLTMCPCCGHAAIARPARGWTWVDADKLLEGAPECKAPKRICGRCMLNAAHAWAIGKAGLIWVGEEFYRNVSDFETEIAKMGVSRRITNVPRGFIVGETYVLLAHRKAVMWQSPAMGQEPKFAPGIFRIWKPQRIEIIVTGEEPDEVIDDYIKRGLSPVKIVREEAKQDRFG